MKQTDSTLRFSNTVDHYIRYRPGYPAELLDFMVSELNLKPDATIADIGSGTGKLTELFVKNGQTVFAVEPNQEMRRAAEELLSPFSNFHSINGTAENSTLADQSVDFITAGQAFHWFGVKESKSEFHRILKTDGKTLLIWNKREDEKSAFMEAYNTFLTKWATDYEETCLRRIDKNILCEFYAPNTFLQKNFYHYQSFDQAGLIGRYLSCSYAFDENHPQHVAALNVLKSIFEQFQEKGIVKMWYRTEVYYNN